MIKYEYNKIKILIIIIISINIFNYPTLSNYAILAASGITTTYSSEVANGFWGSTPTPTYGTLVGSGTPSGVNSTNAGTAQTQLTALVGALNALPTPINIPAVVINTPQTYTPGTYESTSTISYTTGASITLDAQGNPNAQFVFRAVSSITFNNVSSINLINGARNCNVFWLAGSAISFTGTNPPRIQGIFIAQSAITFANPSGILGRLYAQTANVTFGGSSGSRINASCTPVPVIPDDPLPVSNICFLGNTPITTDQGDILIKDIDTNIHTIGNESIVAITRTISLDEYLVCFKANSLDENYPVKQTIVSKDHKILYKGQMIEARKFVDKFTNVLKVKYDREVLYNVLMDKYSTICVNNLVYETLNPENIIAKIYTNKTIKDKNLLISELNKIMLKNHRENKKINTIKQINRM